MIIAGRQKSNSWRKKIKTWPIIIKVVRQKTNSCKKKMINWLRNIKAEKKKSNSWRKKLNIIDQKIGQKTTE